MNLQFGADWSAVGDPNAPGYLAALQRCVERRDRYELLSPVFVQVPVGIDETEEKEWAFISANSTPICECPERRLIMPRKGRGRMVDHGGCVQVQMGVERPWYAVPKGGDLGAAYLRITLRLVGSDGHALFLEYAPFIPSGTRYRKFAVRPRAAEKIRLPELIKDVESLGEVPIRAALLGDKFVPACSVIEAGHHGNGIPFVVVEFDGGVVATVATDGEQPHRCQ